MKILLFLAAALLFSAGGSEVLPVPVPVNPAKNALRNSSFTETFSCSPQKLRYYKGKGVSIKNGKLPAGFTLSTPGQPRHARGSAALALLPDQKNQYLSLNTPCNKFDSGTALISDTLFSLPKGDKEPLYCGVWAKGNGTLIVKFLQKKGNSFQENHTEKILTVSRWHYFRVRVPEKLRGKGELKLSLSAYGQVDMAFPEIAPLPPVDKAAELLFYAPFENGSLDAGFSRGPVSSHGTPALQAVKGKYGQAVRFDRKRRLNKNGKMRYHIGFGYDFLGKALDRERGTIEFFFKPLAEMLQKQTWGNVFPLFYLGDTTWQWANAQDFHLQMELLPGNKIRLSCSEYLRKKSWPDGILMPNNTQKTQSAFIPDEAYVGKFQSYEVKPYGEFIISDAKKFIGTFHHLAFTYDEKSRTVWLDGQPVIRLKALKKPAVSSRTPKLLFAQSHLAHPATMSADLDELKIYSQVKYHKPFTPSALPPQLTGIKAAPAKQVPLAWKSGKPYLSRDKKALCFPLTRGKEKYTLEAACADGLPLIFSPKNASFNLRTPYQVDMPFLSFELKKVSADTAELFNARRGVTLNCRLIRGKEHCRLEMKITKGPSRFRAYLEPRVTLRTTPHTWQYAFDGAEKRQIFLPFYPFEFEDVFMALPMAAAWNSSRGSALALTPDSLCSWMSRGMSSSYALFLKVRTVLNTGEKTGFNFDLLSFVPRYGENDAVDRYHALHPRFFRLDKKADPHIYGNIALQETWDNAAFRQRKALSSLPELNRRTRSTWCWYYYDGSSTGNFSADPELLAELAPINIRHLGDKNYHTGFFEKKTAEWTALKNMGINPGLYVSYWLDRRFQRYFAFSDYESKETYSGIDFWPQYWCRNVVDHAMLPSGTEYGTALRRQVQRLLDTVKSCNMISFDLCGYNYKFRQQNTLGGLNAFDEEGAFLQNSTALALLLDDIKKMKNHTRYRTAVAGNVDLHLSGFPSSFRQDNTIHEQQTLLTIQAEQLRRRQTRLQGERPTTLYNMPRLDGNFFGDEDPRLLRYAALAAHHSHVLTGLLYNIRVNYEIFGVKESVLALDALRRTQDQGYRQTAGAVVSGDLELVRYGEISRGTIGVVNASPWKRSGTLVLDTAYFNAVPLAASEGKEITFDNSRIALKDIPPLSWQLIEFAAAVPGSSPLAYRSTLTRTPDKTEAVFTFTGSGFLKGLQIKTQEHETLHLTFNGRKTARVPEKVKAGDTLVITFGNPLWLTGADKVIAADYGKNGVVTLSAKGKNARIAAERIAEFFRWYNAVTRQGCPVKTVPAGGFIHVEETASSPAGISLTKNGILLKGNGDILPLLTDEYLKALENRYSWYGLFGTQQPTRFIDWAATGLQKRFLKRHGLCGKVVSVEKAAADFLRFLEEKKINPSEGF
ncbi:MAG: hypothetical protein IKC65_02445 [Lentisphaeria bacterium]|nr:hypothetical protein [Lentisphaeria bacterium]